MGTMSDALWRSRLRWRMRGAWQWPTFGAALVVDTLLLHFLPIAGDRGPGLFPALLLAGFFNLLVVAVGAPLAGVWLRRRRLTMPKVVADDRAGTALLVAMTGLLLLLGVAHRPAVRAEEDAVAAQARQARAFVLAQAPTRFRRNVDRMDTWKQGPDLYRTCVPGPDPRRDFCVLVTTDQSPPGVTRDPDQRPNATVAGPDNPGRQGS
jgi:hypothetical protein